MLVCNHYYFAENHTRKQEQKQTHKSRCIFTELYQLWNRDVYFTLHRMLTAGTIWRKSHSGSTHHMNNSGRQKLVLIPHPTNSVFHYNSYDYIALYNITKTFIIWKRSLYAHYTACFHFLVKRPVTVCRLGF